MCSHVRLRASPDKATDVATTGNGIDADEAYGRARDRQWQLGGAGGRPGIAVAAEQ